ncbi:nucleotidyltransferase domain-containing protein [Clostridium peptidivorans]|uniref:nucleotidyltransferase domain-containing protein n=1 Tax=Clostridium peptidivorans TaxID=100174 RepID=UPI000BE36731|nr:nucleotidyltransferase domain-containing protein [Clostridium peptidivorans]
MNVNKELKDMLNDFSKLEEVEGILLAGSHATKTNDKDSDYDIYIYVSKEIPIEKRKIITDKFCSYMELNNTFWETEDDGMLKEDNIPIEIIYRELDFFDAVLNRTLIKCEADIGYTTCFWANLINSIILYDKNGKLNKLQEKYKVAYPYELKQNIVRKNYPLLKLQMPAYYHQIEKALKRDDYISVNHRVAALLASYFDIIFAINEMPHPGEKKLLKIIKDKNLKVPCNMEMNINNILKFSSSNNSSILLEIDSLVNNLDTLLKKEGLWQEWIKN